MSQFTRVTDVSNRRRLRSADQQTMPSHRLFYFTVGPRAFPIVGARPHLERFVGECDLCSITDCI